NRWQQRADEKSRSTRRSCAQLCFSRFGRFFLHDRASLASERRDRRQRMTTESPNSKLQLRTTSRAGIQRIFKDPRSKASSGRFRLKIDVWNFTGAWMLEFGDLRCCYAATFL